MAGMGPPPKPGAIRRNKPTLGEWIELPREGRQGPPPALPKWRSWHEATVEAWAGWWSTPQATQWDPSGRSLWRWALLFDRLMTDPDCPVSVHTQMNGIEDRHGFSHRAMVNLRWRLRADEVGAQREQRQTAEASPAKRDAKKVADRLKRVQ
jgi:hypothetical protein